MEKKSNTPIEPLKFREYYLPFAIFINLKRMVLQILKDNSGVAQKNVTKLNSIKQLSVFSGGEYYSHTYNHYVRVTDRMKTNKLTLGMPE